MKKLISFIFAIIFLNAISSCEILSSAASSKPDEKSAKESSETIRTIIVPDSIFTPFISKLEGGFAGLLKWINENDINNAIVLNQLTANTNNLVWFDAFNQLLLHAKPEIFNALFEKNANVTQRLKDIINYLKIREFPPEITLPILNKALEQDANQSNIIEQFNDLFFQYIEKLSPGFKKQWESAKSAIEKIKLIKQTLPIFSESTNNDDKTAAVKALEVLITLEAQLFQQIEIISPGFKKQWQSTENNAEKIKLLEDALTAISKHPDPNLSIEALRTINILIDLGSEFLTHVTEDLFAELTIIQIEKAKQLKNRDEMLPPLLKAAETFNAAYQKRTDVDPKLKERLQAVLKAQ